eukprot:8145583-Alexandrium_andersonii.AAC.1
MRAEPLVQAETAPPCADLMKHRLDVQGTAAGAKKRRLARGKGPPPGSRVDDKPPLQERGVQVPGEKRRDLSRRQAQTLTQL